MFKHNVECQKHNNFTTNERSVTKFMVERIEADQNVNSEKEKF